MFWLPLVAAALAAGTNIYSAHKQDKYNQEMDTYSKAQDEKAAKDYRRQAISRALQGGGTQYIPRSSGSALNRPSAPNLTGSSILGGLAQLGGNLGANYRKPQAGLGGGGGQSYLAM